MGGRKECFSGKDRAGVSELSTHILANIRTQVRDLTRRQVDLERTWLEGWAPGHLQSRVAMPGGWPGRVGSSEAVRLSGIWNQS